MANYKTTEKVLNNCGTDCYKKAPKARELSDASMSVRKKQEAPKKIRITRTKNQIQSFVQFW